MFPCDGLWTDATASAFLVCKFIFKLSADKYSYKYMLEAMSQFWAIIIYQGNKLQQIYFFHTWQSLYNWPNYVSIFAIFLIIKKNAVANIIVAKLYIMYCRICCIMPKIIGTSTFFTWKNKTISLLPFDCQIIYHIHITWVYKLFNINSNNSFTI